MRLRVGIPARELARRIPVCLVPVDYVHTDPALAELGKVCAIVVSKLPVSFFAGASARSAALLDWIESTAATRRVLVDFCDDLAAAADMYGLTALREVQRRLLRACEATVPTAALRDRLLADARHGVTVIEDPYESPHAAVPRFAPDATLRLVWFGVFGPPLRDFLETAFTGIARRLAPRPIELAFVTHTSQASLVADIAQAIAAVHPHFRVRFAAWSLEASAREIDAADLVVLPQDAASRWGSVKSHNRLVESIRAGRFAVASPVPAYRELAAYGCIDDDLASGVEWALANPDDVLKRITAGQAYVAERFSPARIAAQWARALGV